MADGDRAETASESRFFGIAELAARHDVTPRAIRFYESKGLLAPARAGGQRVFTQQDDKRLSLLLRAKAIGLKLADIKTFLDLYGREGEGRERQLRFVIEKTGEKIEELEARRARIDETLAELRVIHDGAKTRLTRRTGG